MRIYLDHNATTPLRDEVVEAMLPFLRGSFGNPSSTHAEGACARDAVERARGQVAALLGADADEIVFTSGATEANNIALCGWLARGGGARRLVTSNAEHPSVSEPAARLEAQGAVVARLSVDAAGRLDPDDVAAAIDDETALVSMLWANNETGVVQPMQEIARRVGERGVPLHVDATQALGKWPVAVRQVPVDSLACSAHKLNGPKGTGCLFVRSGGALPPLVLGGAQERGHRGGTENVAGIVGFGEACELARRELSQRMQGYAALRDRLWRGLYEAIPRLRRNGDPDAVLPNTLNVEFEACAGDVLVQAMDLEGVAVSAGAACHSGSISPSHVLTAMGRTPQQALGSLRLSLGQGVDAEQLDRVVEVLARLVERVREAGAR